MFDVTDKLTHRGIGWAVGEGWGPRAKHAPGSPWRGLVGEPYGCLERSWSKGRYYSTASGGGSWSEPYRNAGESEDDCLSVGEVWGLLVLASELLSVAGARTPEEAGRRREDA